MGSKGVPLPEQRDFEYAHKLAYQLAREQLPSIDLERQCHRSGAHYQAIGSERIITLEFLNCSYKITLPNTEVSLVDSEEEVLIREKILILHYLITAQGTPLSNKMITYKELPEGISYFRTFSKRVIKPIVHYFGENPQLLIDLVKEVGGHKTDYGDAAVTISAFKFVPITLVLWQGDEEFAPEGSVMFDSTISDYLSPEDKIVLCETLIWKLVRLLKQAKSPPSA